MGITRSAALAALYHGQRESISLPPPPKLQRCTGKFNIADPVCNELVQPLFAGGFVTTCVRQAKAISLACPTEAPPEVKKLGRLGTASNAERDLHRLMRRELAMTVPVDYIDIPIVDVLKRRKSALQP